MRKSLLVFLLLTSFSAIAQESVQVIRGKITNATTQIPVSRATILIQGNSDYDVKSDSLGQFEIPVALGKYSLLVQSKNFKSVFRKNVVVVAGKQQVQDFELDEFKVELDSVTVKPQITSENINLDLWNIQRMAAVFYDPGRQVNAHAGVVNTDDQSNNVSVRGTSPNYVQWKIEGVEIVNPNHLENAGTLNDRPSLNGGGVSMFSAQLLQNSEFQFAPFDPTMGNASSGIFDMKLRNGNNAKTEHIIQASLLGLDVSMEGPFSKKSAASYLFNCRYSTVGLLSLMGVNFGDEKINYMDLSYMVTYPHKRGQIKLFGVLGSSENIYLGKTDSTKLELQKDLLNINYRSFTTINGINNLVTLSNSMFLKSIVAYSTKEVSRTSSSSSNLWSAPDERDNYTQQKISTLNYISKRFNNWLRLKTGVYVNYFINEVHSSVNDFAFASGKISDPIIEPFVSFEGTILKKLEFKTGFHGMYLPNISYFSLQPRILLKYSISDIESISFNYGLSSQLQPSYIYLTNVENRDLKPTISNSFSLIHQLKIKRISIKNEFYYQLFNHIPVDPTIGFSAFNYFNEQPTSIMEQNGKATVYGYDLTIERDFKNFYIIASSSIYNSEYRIGSLNKKARFNTGYNFALTTGKEFALKSGNKFISTDIRAVFRNGFREPNTDYVNQYVYETQLPEYNRIDLRISYRKNRKNSSVIWAIDIENVANNHNVSYHYYDAYTKKVETKYQLGLIPVLSYKVLF